MEQRISWEDKMDNQIVKKSPMLHETEWIPSVFTNGVYPPGFSYQIFACSSPSSYVCYKAHPPHPP